MTNDTKIDLLHEDVKDLKGNLKEINESLQSIDKTLVRNTESLDYHIKRTNILESEVKTLKEDLKPVEKHVHSVNVIMKVATSIGAIVAVIYYIFQIMDYFKH